jgi:hypothetical protein
VINITFTESNPDHQTAPPRDGWQNKSISYKGILMSVSVSRLEEDIYLSFGVINGGTKALGLGRNGTRLIGEGKEYSCATFSMPEDKGVDVGSRTIMVDAQRGGQFVAAFQNVGPSKVAVVIECKRLFARNLLFGFPFDL